MSRLLFKGTTGTDVRALQDVLNFHIRRGEPLKVDGIFGDRTDARVREFQRSNQLASDGMVGPNTNNVLFEVTDVTVPLLFMQPLLLTPPTLGKSGSVGIQPPRLIPPLQWPGPPTPPPPPFQFGGAFDLGKLGTLPDLSGPPNALGMKITVPTRKDPDDPFVRSRKAVVELIDDLPVNSKFKAFLVSQVPNPVPRITPPGTGFKWGLTPLFNPLDPNGFGVKGNAQFTVRLTEGNSGQPNVVFGAWGDGKFFLDFSAKKGEARPKVEGNGTVFFGFSGVF